MFFFKNRLLNFFHIRLLKIISKFYLGKIIQKDISEIQYRRMMSFYSTKGVEYGEGTIFYSVKFSSSHKGDRFIIGKNVCLTNCTLLGHDASPATFLKELVNSENVWEVGSRKSFRSTIVIGDNVFVGAGAIILPGVNIGNNVIVAAGSIVTKDVQDDVIVAGNPAKVVSDLNKFKDKYLERYKNNPENF